jgi:hypothetical protein
MEISNDFIAGRVSLLELINCDFVIRGFWLSRPRDLVQTELHFYAVVRQPKLQSSHPCTAFNWPFMSSLLRGYDISEP